MAGKEWVVVAEIVGLAALSTWVSRVNALFFFGRTVSAAGRYSDAARTITRRYVVGIWGSAILCLALAAMAGHWNSRAGMYACVLLTAVLNQIAFARANAEARRLQGESPIPEGHVVEVALCDDGDGADDKWWIPKVATALAPAGMAAAVLAAAVLYFGHEDARAGWNALSTALDARGSSFLLGFSTAFVCTGVAILLAFRASARLRTRMAQYTLRTSLAMAWTGVVVLACVLGFAARGESISIGAARVVAGGFLVLALATSVWNQARSKRLIPPAAEMNGDDRWRWGLYYWDPADPALFVQRRTGSGFTLNFARGWAWAITAVFAAYLVGMVALKVRH